MVWLRGVVGNMADIEITAVDVDKALAIFQDPARMDKIAAHVTIGGSVADLCKLQAKSTGGSAGLLYVQTMAWIKSDPLRKKAYDSAKEARTEWLFERVLELFRAVSEFDIADVLNDDGTVKAVSEWPRSASVCVKSFDVLELPEQAGQIKRVVAWDKNKTLESIGKHLKMFSEKEAATESSWAQMVEESFSSGE